MDIFAHTMYVSDQYMFSRKLTRNISIVTECLFLFFYRQRYGKDVRSLSSTIGMLTLTEAR